MHRILILTASYGEGHNSAARALRSAFAEHSDVAVEIVDIFADLAPRLDQFSRRSYLGLINRAPRVWSAIYRWIDRSSFAPVVLRSLRPHRRALVKLLDARQPSAICCTYPVYAWLLAALRAEGHSLPPVFNVVTDALTINSVWYRAPVDGWFVTDRDSASYLHAAGIPSGVVRVSGFPVSLAFADRPADLQPPEPTDPSTRRVLFMINSGRDRALETIRALFQQKDWQLTVTTGRDVRLKEEVERLANREGSDATIIGWTDRVPELLMTHHLVISKAGGATTQESINALCPMVVNQVVPGQEEGNWELLRRHGAGAYAVSPVDIIAQVHAAFAENAVLWRQWRNGLRQLARPNASREVATEVLSACSRPTTSSR